MDKLKKLSKEKLIKIIHCKDMIIKRQISLRIAKQYQIKHFRNRIKKVRDSLDYLLKHPYSMDTGFHTDKHQRDITCNQPSKLNKKWIHLKGANN